LVGIISSRRKRICFGFGPEVVNYCSFTGITGKNIFLLGPAWSVTKIRPGKSWFCFFGKVQDPAEAYRS
jgi:hypothetical protein